MNGSQRIHDKRGSSHDRRRRRQWLLDTFGDGTTCPCVHCGGILDDASLTVDRIVPGSQGGRYTRDNIQPACMTCNCRRQDSAWAVANAPYVTFTQAEIDAGAQVDEGELMPL